MLPFCNSWNKLSKQFLSLARAISEIRAFRLKSNFKNPKLLTKIAKDRFKDGFRILTLQLEGVQVSRSLQQKLFRVDNCVAFCTKHDILMDSEVLSPMNFTNKNLKLCTRLVSTKSKIY